MQDTVRLQKHHPASSCMFHPTTQEWSRKKKEGWNKKLHSAVATLSASLATSLALFQIALAIETLPLL